MWIPLPESGVKQTEAGFPLGFCLSFHPEKLPSLCQCQAYPYHDAANTMPENKEPVISVMCCVWICTKHKALHLGQKVSSFAMFFSFCITLVPCCIHMHVMEYSVYLYSSFHNSVIIVESLQCWSILSFLPSQPLNSVAVLKITNGLMVTSLSSFLPVLQLSSEEWLHLWCVWVV